MRNLMGLGDGQAPGSATNTPGRRLAPFLKQERRMQYALYSRCNQI